MADHVVCVRRIRRKKFGEALPKPKFDNEPGKTTFLKVPGNAVPNPDHAITKTEWRNEVMADAESGTDSEGRPNGDIVVFVHGYNNDQNIIIRRHRIIKRDLKANGYKGTVISFDWPSASSGLNYLEDRSDAKATAIKLVDDCIKLFVGAQARDCQINVHLLAHSTGAYVIREAFDDADDRPSVARHNWSVSQVMLIGADVSSDSMGLTNPKSSSLYRHCVRLTNYSNPFDSILKLSNTKRVGVAPRVGRVGLPEPIPEKAVDVNCGAYYDKKGKKRQGILGSKSHSWHIGDPMFAKDMMQTILGDVDRGSIRTRVRGDNDVLWLRHDM